MGFGNTFEKGQTFEALKKLNLAELSQDMKALTTSTDKKADTNTHIENLKKKEIATENILENFETITNTFETGGYIKKEMIGNAKNIEASLQKLLSGEGTLMEKMEAHPFNIDNLVQLICEDITTKYGNDTEQRKQYSGKDLANFLSNKENAGQSLLTAASHLQEKISYKGKLEDRSYKQEGLATVTLLIQYYLNAKGNYKGTINGIIGQTGTLKNPTGDKGKNLVEAIDQYCNYDPGYQNVKKEKEKQEEQKRKDKEQKDLEDTIEQAKKKEQEQKDKEKEIEEKKQKDEQTKKETKEKLEKDNKIFVRLEGAKEYSDLYIIKPDEVEASVPALEGKNRLVDDTSDSSLVNRIKALDKRNIDKKTLSFTSLETKDGKLETLKLQKGEKNGYDKDWGLLVADMMGPTEGAKVKELITSYPTIANLRNLEIKEGKVSGLTTVFITPTQLEKFVDLEYLDIQDMRETNESVNISTMLPRLQILRNHGKVEIYDAQGNRTKDRADTIELSQYTNYNVYVKGNKMYLLDKNYSKKKSNSESLNLPRGK